MATMADDLGSDLYQRGVKATSVVVLWLRLLKKSRGLEFLKQ
jgi:hypothetical protein